MSPSVVQSGRVPYAVVRSGALAQVGNRPSVLGTYLVYCAHASPQWEGWPSAGTIARRLGITVEAVRRARRELERVGLLVVTGRFWRKCPIYRLATDPQQVLGYRPPIGVAVDPQQARTLTPNGRWDEQGIEQIKPPPTSSNGKPPAPHRQATPKGGGGAKRSKPDKPTVTLLQRIGVPAKKAALLAETPPSRVLATWVEAKADQKVRHVPAVLPVRLLSAGPPPPLTPRGLVEAIGAGIVERLGGVAIGGKKATWNSGGVYLDGKLMVKAEDLQQVEAS